MTVDNKQLSNDIIKNRGVPRIWEGRGPRISINNFKHAILKSIIYEKLTKNPDSDSNQNYEIFLSALTEAKTNHIPKKTQRFMIQILKFKHRKEKWMTSELRKLVVRKNKLYREWKSTTDDNEYQIMQINFKTYERIVKNKIEETKQKYYFDKFIAQKNDMKKTWGTIDEALNRKRKSTEYPAEFFYNNRTIRDSKDIANSFNEYFFQYWTKLI